MQASSSESTGNLDQARQVCTSCKARKRKCDKSLPKCSACSKRNLACEYSSQQNRNSAPASDPWWHAVDRNRTDIQSIDFPTMLFLDPSLLQYGQVEMTRADPPVPAHILHLLGDMTEIRTTATKFFEHIHLWMPFICKKRFYDLYLQPSFQTRPDIVFLLLALKLIATLPPTTPRNPRTPLYYAVKHFYLEVEGSNGFSIPVLQAGVLLALYELGHAIYPAAFLTVGACARFAHALGINVSGRLNARRVLTLLEVEERRRVWWAIVILDRFVNIGCPGRPFATANPELDDLLPADDVLWDQGIVRPDKSFTMSSPNTGHMSKFALLCQAARLLGQVLQHVSYDSTMQDDVWIQLDRTLQSMLTAALNVDSPDHDQITFIYSALVALYMPWLDSKRTSAVETERFQRGKAVIQQITDTISTNLVVNQCFAGRDPEDLAPWGLFFVYHICGSHLHARRETSDTSAVVKGLREAFLTIDLRWNAAGVYLQLLEAQEVIHYS